MNCKRWAQARQRAGGLVSKYANREAESGSNGRISWPDNGWNGPQDLPKL